MAAVYHEGFGGADCVVAVSGCCNCKSTPCDYGSRSSIAVPAPVLLLLLDDNDDYDHHENS